MNAVDLIAAVREHGGDLRLDPIGELQARHLDRIPAPLVESVQAQRSSVSSALEAETFAASPLPWRPHGPHHLAQLHDGARLLAMRLPGSWALTRRDCPDCDLVSIVAQGTIHDVLAAALGEAPLDVRVPA